MAKKQRPKTEFVGGPLCGKRLSVVPDLQLYWTPTNGMYVKRPDGRMWFDDKATKSMPRPAVERDMQKRIEDQGE